MINSIGQFSPLTPPVAAPVRPPRLDETKLPDGLQEAGNLGGAHKFGNLFANLVGEVNNVRTHAAEESQKVMLGKSDQLHNAVISLQESSVALSLMVEVRNKLVESYQELMRMPV